MGRTSFKKGEVMMRSSELMDLAEVLSEGFMADKIVSNRDYKRASEFVSSVKVAREWNNKAIISIRTSILKDLHNYLRFAAWISKEYGHLPCKSKTEADAFFESTLNSICQDTENFTKFWHYLQEVTLDEGSIYIFG